MTLDLFLKEVSDDVSHAEVIAKFIEHTEKKEKDGLAFLQYALKVYKRYGRELIRTKRMRMLPSVQYMLSDNRIKEFNIGDQFMGRDVIARNLVTNTLTLGPERNSDADDQRRIVNYRQILKKEKREYYEHKQQFEEGIKHSPDCACRSCRRCKEVSQRRASVSEGASSQAGGRSQGLATRQGFYPFNHLESECRCGDGSD